MTKQGLVCLFALLVAVNGVFAEDSARPEVPSVRVGIIPAHWQTFNVEVPCKPKWARRKVPCFKEFKTPVYEWKEVERVVELRVPTGKTETVMQEQCVRTGRRSCDCTSDESGAAVVRKPVQMPTVKKKTLKLGKQMAWVKVGERIDKRCIGYRWQWVNLNQGVTSTTARRLFVQAEAVTVFAEGTERPAPLPGTRRAISEKEWFAATATVGRPRG